MSPNAAFDMVTRLREAITLHRQGRLDDAETVYRDVLAHVLEQPDALHFLGVLEGQRGRHLIALQLMDRAIRVHPRHPAIAYNRANLLRDMGRLDEALAGYDAALELKPDNGAALGNRGAVLHALARYEDAIRSYDRALALRPDDPDANANRGTALASLGRHDEALANYEQALATVPDHLAALYGKGNALAKLGRLTDALASYDRALQSEPANFELLNNRGLVLRRLHRPDDALSSFESAIAAAPASAEAYSNRGIVFMDLRRYSEALHSYSKALERNPDDADALYGRASALIELGRQDEAVPVFERLLRLRADYPYAPGMLVYAQKTACDWRDESAANAMLDAVRDGKRAATPLVLLTVSDSASLKLRCAQILMQDKFPATEQPLWRGEAYRHERIRVAYLSADFRNHAVAILMAGVFEHHDRKRFETIALSHGADDSSPMRARVVRSFERFIDVRGKSDSDVGRLIRDMQIDILVDLTGLTASARPGILALRAAPVQVNYLGFAGTIGAYADYILADRIVIPDDQQSCYSEKVVYLPDTCMPHDSMRPIAERVPPRSELGLPENGFVFASFNNSYKFASAVFDIWMRLLREVASSVLWLGPTNVAARRNLRREAELRGVSGDRIVFAPYLPAAEDHLARLRAADLFLDTLPYNAHTTACDALWAGLPVLTCKGTSFAGAVAASLLRACDLPELIADSLAAYEAKAFDLVHNRDMLASIRSKLLANRNTCALFDTKRFTRNLERAYIAMWTRVEAGVPPQSFGVEAGDRL